MNGQNLFEAIGNIDEKYMQDLDTTNKIVFFKPKVYSAVACMVVAIVCAGLFYQSKHSMTDVNPQEVEDSGGVGYSMFERNIMSDEDILVTYQNQVYTMEAQIALDEVGVNYTEDMISLGEIGTLENNMIMMESGNDITGYVYYDEAAEKIIIYCTGGDLEPSFIILKK